MSDTTFILELLNSDGWLRFIGDRNVRTEEQARQYLQNGPLKSYAMNGHGLSLVELKDSKKPVGMCGILKRDALQYPDIGFAFLPDYSGKGYALEIAQATIAHAHQSLGIPLIAAITLPDNERSIRLLEKLGLTFTEEYTSPGSTDKLLMFRSRKTE